MSIIYSHKPFMLITLRATTIIAGYIGFCKNLAQRWKCPFLRAANTAMLKVADTFRLKEEICFKHGV